MRGSWGSTPPPHGGEALGPTVHANLMALDRGVAAAAPAGRAAGALAWFLDNFDNPGDAHCCTNPDTAAMVAARAGVNFTVVYYWVFQQLYAGDTRALDVAVLALHDPRKVGQHGGKRRRRGRRVGVP